MRAAHATRAGFTLIEVLAVILLMTMLLGVALNFYVDLSNASLRATQVTREGRRATAILDRVGRDFEAALMERKPAELDPLQHPWIFRGEPRYSETGADQVKFVMRRRDVSRSDGPASDVAMVAYMLRPSEEGEGYALLRWYAPGLPEQLDEEFPSADDPGVLVLADGLENFGVRFLGEDGEWTDTWNSSQLLDSSELPLAVDIDVALLGDEPVDFADEPAQAFAFRRKIILPVRPLDMEVLLDPETYAAVGGAGAGEVTVADCDIGEIQSYFEQNPPAGFSGGTGKLMEQLFMMRSLFEGGQFSVAALPPGIRDDPQAVAAIQAACR